MDWSKVDAPLASALASGADEGPLQVFVHLDPSRLDATALHRLGLDREAAGDLATTSLMASDVAALTDEDWVLGIRLSGRLRLLPRGSPPGSGAEAAEDRPLRRPPRLPPAQY